MTLDTRKGKDIFAASPQDPVHMASDIPFKVPNKNEKDAQVVYLSTQEAYAHWASVYDTDGNFLQATDDAQLEDRLPRFLALAGIGVASEVQRSHDEHGKQKIVIDLGCGTGRNTFRLRALTEPTTKIIGLDSSEQMLEIARTKVVADSQELPMTPIFQRFDINEAANAPENISTTHSAIPRADAIISTLVIEHVELEQFFTVASRLLKPGGFMIITNMHSDMGKISRAGFVNSEGVKVRPTDSIPHTIEEVRKSAEYFNFQVLDVAEKEIVEEDVTALGVRSKKWVGVKCWFGMVLRQHFEE